MPASFEARLAVSNNAKTDSTNLYDPFPVPQHLAHAVQSSASPRPVVSAEAMAWYHADNGGLLPPHLQPLDEGLPWIREPYNRNKPTSLFSGLGVPPLDLQANRKAANVPCKWRGPKKQSWALQLLPERPPSMIAAIGRNKSGNPISEVEKRDARYTYRPPKPIRPPRQPLDPILSLKREDVPKATDDNWMTESMRAYSPRAQFLM
jgi:hypothetical protein